MGINYSLRRWLQWIISVSVWLIVSKVDYGPADLVMQRCHGDRSGRNMEKKIFIFHVPRSSSADCTHRLCSQSTFTELLVWWWYFYVLSLYSTVNQQVVFISPSAAHLFNAWLLCRIIPKNSHSHHSVKSFYWNVNKSYGDFWRGVTVWELCEKVPVKQSH